MVSSTFFIEVCPSVSILVVGNSHHCSIDVITVNVMNTAIMNPAILTCNVVSVFPMLESNTNDVTEIVNTIEKDYLIDSDIIIGFLVGDILPFRFVQECAMGGWGLMDVGSHRKGYFVFCFKSKSQMMEALNL